MNDSSPFYIYDTRQRKKTEFIPKKKGIVTLYSCGPTVYNSVHVGNIRAVVFYDSLYRWLRYGKKYDVQWGMNITDVDDKTIRDSKKQYPDLPAMEALKKFTEFYSNVFFQDLAKVNINVDNLLSLPKATDYIQEMQVLIQKIVDNGYGYIVDGSVYLDVKKYRNDYVYGQLVTLDFDAQISTSRVENDEYEKEDIADFVLWKAKKQGEPSWDFALIVDGKELSLAGRPGWHIECSAMSKSLFPDFPFDIHIGGVDLCFPHHEDEICQARAGYGVDTAKYWAHNEHLMVEGKKMSKSLGNFYTLDDLEAKNFSGEVVRFFLATNHYRTKINLSDDSLFSVQKMLERIRNFVDLSLRSSKNTQLPLSFSEKDCDTFLQKFYVAMDDDMNSSVAVAEFFEFVQNTAKQGVESSLTQKFKDCVTFVENVFGVSFLPKNKEVEKKYLDLLEERNTARKEKNWEESDRIRDILASAGYRIRDEKDGATLVSL